MDIGRKFPDQPTSGIKYTFHISFAIEQNCSFFNLLDLLHGS